MKYLVYSLFCISLVSHVWGDTKQDLNVQSAVGTGIERSSQDPSAPFPDTKKSDLEKQEESSQFIDESKSFSENLKNLEIPDSFKLDDIVIGDEQAPHTLIVYSSFSCNHCCKFHKEEFPKLKKQYVDAGKLRIVLRNYIDDLGALEAAILMRIFYKKSKDAIALYRMIFGVQKDWMKSSNPREFLKQIFIKAGYDKEEVANYLDTNNQEYKKISAGLMKEQQWAMHVLQISSVPAFVLDNRVHQGVLTSEEIIEKMGMESEKKLSDR